MTETADVVVIGGGVHGASAAWHLATRGMGKIVLLEKAGLASGASGWSSAIVRLQYSIEPLVRMALFGRRMFENWGDVVGGDCGFRRTGYLLLLSEKEAASAKSLVEMQRGAGAETRIIDADEVAVIEPRIALADVAGAAWEPESGHADGTGTANAFAEGAIAAGAVIRTGTSVLRISASDSGISRVETDSGPIETRTVVLAAGYRSSALLEPLGVALPITPIRHTVAIVERSPGFGAAHTIVVDRTAGAYYRPEADELTLLGDSDPLTGHEDHRVEDNKSPSMEDQLSLVEKFMSRFPGEENARLRRGYTGVYDCTPDFQPAIGKVAAVPGLYIAAGFSGHGFKLSPAVGSMLADLIAGDRPGVADISQFRIERFAEGKLISADDEHGLRTLA